MARRKARKPASGRSGTGSTGLARAGELKWPEATNSPHTCLAVVYDGQCCLGHIIARGKTGVEAFDWRDKSIGIYRTVKLAAAAVSEAARAFHDGGER